ncbi:MAG: transketolase [FCB group bacterium]|jgi:transketolase
MNKSEFLDNIEFYKEKANALRATCIQMAFDGKENHLKGALSCIEILIALYHYYLNINPEKPHDEKRDRFIFSKGHSSTALYTTLCDRGFFEKELLLTYAKNDTKLPSHLCKHALPLLDWSSGSLGHGLGIGTGMAYGLKLKMSKSKVVVLLSDGECNEGSTWEAAQFAKAKELDNLVAIVDYNGIQSIDFTDKLTGYTSFAEKFKAFGWNTIEVDGHNFSELLDAFDNIDLDSVFPTALICKTVSGKGVSFIENDVLWHYRTPSKEDLANAMVELNSKPIHLK